MPRTPAPPVNGWVGYPLGFTAAIAVTVLTVAAHATSRPLWSVVALTVTATTVAALTTLPAALATASVCWLLHAGFVLGRQGELEFTDESGAVAALLGAVTVVTNGTSVAIRAGRRWRAVHRVAPTPYPTRVVGAT